MSAPRVGEWHLLGFEGDPVPASPVEIREEATHYSGVAGDIATQISRLRRLTHPDELLKGEYVDGLTSSCEDLADHLSKIEDRFSTTSARLFEWATDVTNARSGTRTALTAAEDAQRRADNNAPVDYPDGTELTEAQQTAADNRATRLGTAQEDLQAAQGQARGVMSTLDERAEDVARKIKDASDDDMKDSRWDKFKDFVGSIAGVLDAIADVLGWIATALVIAALFIPGLNVLVLAAILLAGALLLHTLLAVTGNGSWLDVAFDIIGLATLGIGSTAMSAARVGRAATLANAGRNAGTRASAQFLSRASFNGGRGLIGGAHSFFLRTFSPTVRAGMRTSYDDALRAWTQRALPESSVLQALRAGGDRGLAALARDHRLLIRELGEAAIDPRYTQQLQIALNATRTGAVTGLIPQLSNPKIGDAALYDLPPYDFLSDSLTFTIGGPF